MHNQQVTLGLINVAGGIAVIGSYVYGLWTHPANRGAIWGGVPETIKPLYTVSMLLAALGYFAFSYLILFRLDPDQVQIGHHFGFKAFYVLYAVILAASALWMPLTFAMVSHPSTGLWVGIRLTLVIVGLGSLGLLAALLYLEPREPPLFYWLAVAGSALFCLQTAVLDALVWPAFYKY